MNQSSGQGKVTFSFQTDGSTANNSYKIAVITQQTGTTNIVVKFDSFQIGPSAIVLGAVVTDWVSYTPTITTSSGSVTNAAHVGKWRRVGDSIEVRVSTTFSAASSAFTSIIYSLPSGLSFDTSKFSDVTEPQIGISRALDAGVIMYGTAPTVYVSATTFRPTFPNSLGATSPTQASNITNLLPFTFGATGTSDTIETELMAPIVGWSSSVQVSSDTDTRVVAMSAGTLSSTTISIGADLIFTTKTFDTHGAYNSSTGVYTVPVSGVYDVSVVLYNTSVATAIYVKKNGSALDGSVQTGLITSASTSNYGAGSRLVSCNAGDTISIASNQAATATASGNTLQIKRLSGPSVIAASESVNANYYTTSAGSMAVGTPAVVVFGTRSFDSHNAYNSTTGIYTVPVSGKYQVNTTITSTSTSQIQSLVLDIMKNGTTWNRFSPSRLTAVTSALSAINSAIVAVNAGDTIEIRCSVTSGTGNFDGNAFGNNFTIARVGN
jgi:hypothetical protein